jgi:hypothetical protein
MSLTVQRFDKEYPDREGPFLLHCPFLLRTIQGVFTSRISVQDSAGSEAVHHKVHLQRFHVDRAYGVRKARRGIHKGLCGSWPLEMDDAVANGRVPGQFPTSHAVIMATSAIHQ